MADTATLARIDVYHASVPIALNALRNLKSILGKAEAWAAEKTSRKRPS